MPHFCCIVKCSNRSKRDKKSFFRLPAVLKTASDERIRLSVERRFQWLSAINRADITTEHRRNWLRVCSDHFITGKPAKLEDRYDPDWVPSLKLGHNGKYSRSNVKGNKFSRKVNLERKAGRAPFLTYAQAAPAQLTEVTSVPLNFDIMNKDYFIQPYANKEIKNENEAGRAPFLSYAQASPVQHTEVIPASLCFNMISHQDNFIQPYANKEIKNEIKNDKSTSNGVPRDKSLEEIGHKSLENDQSTSHGVSQDKDLEENSEGSSENEESSLNDIPEDKDVEENDHESVKDEESSTDIPQDKSLEEHGHECSEESNCKRIKLDNIPALEEPAKSQEETPIQIVFPQSCDKEDLFGVYVATEMKTMRHNPVLYLQTVQAILDVLASAKSELIQSY